MSSQALDSGMSTRRENRAPAPFVAQMRRGPGMMQPVTIRDISSHGLQGTCFNPPSEGEQITIRFENGRSVHGLVKWARKGIFGLEFRTTVNVAMVTENVTEHPLRRSTDFQ